MPVLRRPVEPAGIDRKWLAYGQNDANDPKRSCVGAADHSEIGWTDVCEVLS